MKRRTFVQSTSALTAGLLVPKLPSYSKSKLTVAIIGTGLRGQGHIDLLLRRDDITIIATADPDAKMTALAMKLFEDRGLPLPKTYTQGNRDYLRMLDTEKPDAVIIATPWEWHVEQAVAGLERNIYVGLEVAGGLSINDSWQLVNAQEASSTHLYFLENVCFRRDVMAVLNMVRKDMFGELIHLECGYQHDLRGVKFNDGVTPYNSGVEFGEKGYSESKWRTQHSINRNGELYPTHGLGPVAQYININKGNRLTHLTSMASKSRGLHNYIVNHPKGGAEHPNAQVEFALGDKVTTMLRCHNGETIVMHHDTNLPRPYSLGFRVQGTKGLWMDLHDSVHIEGQSPAHRWESDETYMEKYDHPLWKKYEHKAEGAGHGGMDFFLIHSFVEHAKKGERPPFDVYDAATWMAITPLSEQSIALGSQPQAIPDFTNGQWATRKNTFALSDDY